MVRWLQRCVSPSLAMICALTCTAENADAQPQKIVRELVPLPNMQVEKAGPISHEQLAQLLRAAPRPQLTPLPFLTDRRSYQDPSGLAPPDTARRSPWRPAADATLPNVVDLFAGKSQDTASSQDAARTSPQGKTAPQFEAQATTASTASCAPTTPIVEIAALTRALRCDAALIYEHVYNNIGVLPIYGSLKGPLGTLLDGKGTPIDIAELTTMLLREAGYDAVAAIGQRSASIADLASWLETDVNYNSVATVLGSGKISAQDISSGYASISWSWVKLTTSEGTYYIDPATKTYSRFSGLPANIPLVNLMGYDRDSFFSLASSAPTNATTVNAGQINRDFVRSYLGAYAGNLASNLPTFAPGASTSEVIGGKAIVPLATNRPIQLANMAFAVRVTDFEGTSIPVQYRHVMTVSFSNGALLTIGSSDAYGRRLSVFVNQSNQPVLKLDGNVVATGPATSCNDSFNINIAITTPGFASTAVGNETRKIPLAACTQDKKGRYIISNGWGPVGRGMIEKHRNLLQARSASGEAPDSEGVLGESLAILGFNWLGEYARIQAITDHLGGVSTNYFRGVGIVGIKPIGNGLFEGPFVDLPINLVSLTQRSGRPNTNDLTPVETAAFFTIVGVSSVLESGVIEQTQAPSQAIAASTIKLMDEAIRTGPILSLSNAEGTAGNASQLSNYGAQQERIQNVVSQGSRVIAPQNGSIPLQNTTYQGSGWLEVTADERGIGAIISGGLSGGLPATPVSVGQLSANSEVTSLPSAQSPTVQAVGIPQGGESGVQRLIGDPINTATGAYIYSHDDLTVGDAIPYGLGFQRTYDSAQRYVNGPLGLGWTHNFAISARRDSDGFEGMAESSPISGAPTIAAIRVLLDVLQHPANTRVPLDRVVVAAVIQRWLMDQLTNNVVTVVQPGSTERFTLLPDGRYVPQPGSASTLTGADGSYVFRTKDQNTLTFNGANKLSTLQYANGPVLTLSYDGNGRLEYVDNQMYRRLIFTYSGDYLSEVYDYTGRKFTYTVDGAGDLVSVRDAMGQTTRYTYGIKGLLFEIFYPSFPSNPFASNLYDDLGRMQFQRDALGYWSSLFFAGARSELQDPSGASQTLYLTPQGKPRVEIDGTGYATTYEYDGQNRVSKRTLPEGNSIAYAYDARNNVTQETHTSKPNSSLGTRTRQFTYQPTFNKVASSTDFAGNVTNYSYDGAGNLIEILQPAVIRHGGGSARPRTTYTYDSRGRRVTETDAEGRVTRYDYDPNYAQLVATVVDQGPGRLNLTTNYSYDTAGNRTLATDGNGQQTTFDYDAMRRVVTTRPPSGSGDSPTTYEYDADGRQTLVQRAAGIGTQATRTRYLPSGQVASITDASGNVAEFGYNPIIRHEGVRDGENRPTTTVFDANGRVFLIAEAGSVITDMRLYTQNGILAERGDSEGTSKVTYARDGFDRLRLVCYHQSPGICSETGGLNGTFEQFGYTADDDVTYRRSRKGQFTTWTYDALHRPVTKTGSPQITYTYDLVGRLRTATTPIAEGDPSTGKWEKAYDTAGRLGNEGSPDGRVTGFGRDGAGNRTVLCIQNSDRTNACFRSTYDALNRHVSTMTNNQLSVSEIPLWTDYFDALGRLQTRARINASTTGYGYAGASNDVTGISHTFLSAPSNLYAYAYNRAHQVISHSSTVPLAHPAAPGTESRARLDDANRLTGLGYDHGDVSGDGTRSYTYDGEGAGRVMTATFPGGSASYRYDPFGRRYSKTVNGVTTVFLHDEADNEVAEFDGASGTLLRYRLYSGNSTGAPVVTLREDGYTGEAIPALDRLGSVMSTSDGYGQYLGATAYLPYGQSQTGTPPPGSGFGFAGYRYDAETGLYYVRNRYYDPRLGRWLQPDPIGQEGGVNLYAYVNNDPLNLTDPSGNCPWCIFGAVVSGSVELTSQIIQGADPFSAYRSGGFAGLAGSLGKITIAAGAGAATGGVGTALELVGAKAVVRAGVTAFYGSTTSSTAYVVNSCTIDRACSPEGLGIAAVGGAFDAAVGGALGDVAGATARALGRVPGVVARGTAEGGTSVGVAGAQGSFSTAPVAAPPNPNAPRNTSTDGRRS